MSVTWKRSVGWGVAAGAALMWTGPVSAQELAPEGRIGEGDGPILGNVSDLGFLSDGRLVVLDEQANTLHWYAADGSFLKSVSREGQGPGEIGGSSDIAIDGLDRVVALDYGNLRVSIWDAEGEFLGGVPLRDLLPPGGYPVSVKAEGEGVWLKSTSFEVPARNRLNAARLDFALESPVLESTVVMEWEADDPSCTFCDWSLHGERAALVVGDTLYRVREFAAGESTGVEWRRTDLAAAAMTEDEIAERTRILGSRVSVEGGSGAPEVDPWHSRFPSGRISRGV